MDKLIDMCSLYSVSGSEYKMTEYIKNYTQTFCDEVITDSMGNVVAKINNNSDLNVVLEAHIDNVGLVVREIDNKGFIKFMCSGGIDSSILPTAEVIVHGKKDLFGVIGAKPPHLQTKEDDGKKNSAEDMYIDCGYDCENISEYVSVGNTITLLSKYNDLKGGFLTSGSLDNRVGCYIVSECIKRLKTKKLSYNVSGVFSVQEEVGCRGAKKAVSIANPDIAIIVDVTFGISPYTDNEHGFEVGDGITVAVGPNLDRKLTDKFIELCDLNNIPYKKEVCSDHTGTDAWPIQIACEGIRCILVSVPIKYMHTTVELANKKDIDNAINAICLALEGGIL